MADKPTKLNPYTGPDSGAQDFGDDFGRPAIPGNRVLDPAEALAWEQAQKRKAVLVVRVKQRSLADLGAGTFDLVDDAAVQQYLRPDLVRFNPNHDQLGHFASGDAMGGLAGAIKQHGGFTIRAFTGKVPKTGWMVSYGGAEKAIPAAEVTKQTLEDYRDAHESLLHSPDAYLGAWNDQADGKVYLDVSQNVQNEADAEKLGVERNQYAIYNNETGEYRPVASERNAAKSAEAETVKKGLEMTYLDPDDLDASWEALQQLIAGDEGDSE